MTTLHLGVLDIPYPDQPHAQRVAKPRPGRLVKPPAAHRPPLTTGDVAEALERRYHIMQTFYDTLGEDAVVAALQRSVDNALADITSGAPLSLDPVAAATSELHTAFQIFIDQREMDGRAGVPTKASLHGVNHRMLHPFAKRGPRPSFKDTGLYEGSERAWTD